MLLLGVVLLAACGEDTASDDNVTETNNNDATESEEGNEPEEEENTNNEGTDIEANEGTEVEEGSTEENDVDSSGFMEDQQVKLGETATYDATTGTFEITLNSVRTVDEVDGNHHLMVCLLLLRSLLRMFQIIPLKSKTFLLEI